MPHQYKAGDVVTVFQISPSNELVIEGKATIRTRVAEVDEYYRVEFANKPGVTYARFTIAGASTIRRGMYRISIGVWRDSRPQQWGRLPYIRRRNFGNGRRNRHVRVVPKADSCGAANSHLFDHLVGAH